MIRFVIAFVVIVLLLGLSLFFVPIDTLLKRLNTSSAVSYSLAEGNLFNGRINDVAMALEQIGGRNLCQCRVSMDKKITKPTLYLLSDLDKHSGKKPQEIVDEYYFPVVPVNTNDGGHF